MVIKSQRKLLSLILTALLVVNLMFVGITSVSAEGIKTIDLVEVTDFHGQLLDSTGKLYVGAALSKAVKDIKVANPDTLILGGGDLYQGTPLSNVLHGVPVKNVFTDMGLAYTALGNHEFDWGLNTIINETMTGAGYSILCANVYNKTTGQRVFNPYAITTIDGVRIAVIGAIKTDAPTIILPANVADYNFVDAATEINNCAQEIRSQNLADVVLTVIHEGGTELQTVVNNLHGVDAVFGGHSHTSLDTMYIDADGKSVPTYNANASGKGYIDAKMTVDTDNHTISFSATGNYKALTTTSTTPLDSTAKSIIDTANADLAPVFNEVIGSIPAPLTSAQVAQPFGESQLGNWISDVIKNYAGADVGMQNNGGIRLSPIPAGDITVGTIFNLMPFDNTVCSVDLTGAQLKALLNQAVKDGGKGIQVSGIKFNYDSTKPSGDRITKIVRESNGSLVQDTDVLKVAAPDFLETGGDGFTVFLQGTNFVNTYYLIRDALIKDVKTKGIIPNELPGRITNDAASAPATPMTIAQARAAASGNVILTGVVTTISGSNVFMQDDTAGICFYNSARAAVKKGDQIKVTGVLSVYNGLTEITPKLASDVQVLSSNNPVTPKIVTIGEINESLEGQLVKVENVTLNNIDTAGSSMIQDSTGTIAIYRVPALSDISAGDKVDVTGAVGQYSTSYELFVGSAADVVKLIPVTGISLDNSNLNILISNSRILTATVLPENASNKNVVWKSSDENIATVNNGVVTALRFGTATITATTEDGNYSASATINASYFCEGIVLIRPLECLETGWSEILFALKVPDLTLIQDGIWESSNTAVATVSNGKVTAAGEGTATITLKTADGKFIAKTTITVVAGCLFLSAAA